MNVSVVIPNWNGAHLLKENLKNIIRTCSDAEIILADDHSSDDSVEYIRNKFPQIIIVQGKKREGFAANVNSGVKRSHGDIVVLLNTDVVPDPGFLKSILPHFSDPSVFAVGCLEKSSENGKIVLRGRGIAHWEKGYYIHSRGEIDKTTTAWVSGGSGAYRKSMWDKLGGMDTIYNPFYWEDIDLSYRARKAGWKTIFEPKSIVHHFHEKGTIKQGFSIKEINRIAYRNQFIFIWKNITDRSIMVHHAFWTPIRLLQTLMQDDMFMLQGYLQALVKIPKIFLRRFTISARNITGDRELDIFE